MDKLLMSYIQIKTYVGRQYINTVDKLFNVKSITYYDFEKKKIRNGIYLYYFIKNINYIISNYGFFSYWFTELRNTVDVHTNKIQLIKNNNVNHTNKCMILTPTKINVNKNEMISINDTITYMDNNPIPKDVIMDKCICMKFELIPENTCLKNFIIKYKDTHEEFDHTLKNILIFNDVKFNEETSQIKIQMFNNGKMIIKTLPLAEIIDKHINYFNNLT